MNTDFLLFSLVFAKFIYLIKQLKNLIFEIIRQDFEK